MRHDGERLADIIEAAEEISYGLAAVVGPH
jgi:hypothetical protein